MASPSEIGAAIGAAQTAAVESRGTGGPSGLSESHDALDAPMDGGRTRLGYLDGIRAFAALWVVLGHALSELNWKYDGGGLSPRLYSFLSPLDQAHFAVAVFIVLSGYCLMLPVAGDENLTLKRGWVDFLKRRSRRILPPYYAALVLTLVLRSAVPDLRHVVGARSDSSLPTFTAPVIASHVLLVHNLSAAWAFKINGPMWSIGTEWQIYFLFPAVLLPAMRMGKYAGLLIAGFAIGMIPLLFIHVPTANAWCPWYVCLFAMGMVAAHAVRQGQRDPLRYAGPPWTFLCGALWLALGLCILRPGIWLPQGAAQQLLERAAHLWWRMPLWLQDMLVGAAAACLLARLAVQHRRFSGQRLPPLLRLLGSRWAVILGTFSYSIYLMHSPMQWLLHMPLRVLGLGPDVRVILLIAATPLILLPLWLFHLAFERPFMQAPRPSTGSGTAVAGTNINVGRPIAHA